MTREHIAGEIAASGYRLPVYVYRRPSGEVQATVSDLATLLPLAHDGKIRILAVMDRERTKVAPQIPSIGELGVHGASVGAWISVFARKGTPPEVVSMLNSEINQALKNQEIQNIYSKAGLETWPISAPEMQIFIAMTLIGGKRRLGVFRFG